MPARLRTLALVAIAASLVAGCTGGDDRRRHTETDGCRFEVGRSRKGEIPLAIDGTGRDDIWVVGAAYEGGHGVPFARRWDGEAWRATRVEALPEAISGFHDVAAISEDEAWAVGSLRGR